MPLDATAEEFVNAKVDLDRKLLDSKATHSELQAAMRRFARADAAEREVEQEVDRVIAMRAGLAERDAQAKEQQRRESLAEKRRKADLQREQDSRWLTSRQFAMKYPGR